MSRRQRKVVDVSVIYGGGMAEVHSATLRQKKKKKKKQNLRLAVCKLKVQPLGSIKIIKVIYTAP